MTLNRKTLLTLVFVTVFPLVQSCSLGLPDDNKPGPVAEPGPEPSPYLLHRVGA